MADAQLTQYLPVLLLAAVALGFTAFMLLASVALGKRGARSRIKDTAYECGMIPVGEGHARMSVKFYLVAMLFILFDVEVAFLMPWAVQYKSNLASFGVMILFVATLLIGYVYAWGKGALDWER